MHNLRRKKIRKRKDKSKRGRKYKDQSKHDEKKLLRNST